jgi:antitoxin (DNA-binding transcriptional repressor) of toxin-antitoxin stability system
MRRVKTGYAKNNLSRLLDCVRRGGRVRILDRNTAVADLVPVEPEAPVEPDAEDDAEALLASALRRGVIGTAPPSGPYPPDLIAPGPRGRRGASALSELLAERQGSSR